MSRAVDVGASAPEAPSPCSWLLSRFSRGAALDVATWSWSTEGYGGIDVDGNG